MGNSWSIFEFFGMLPPNYDPQDFKDDSDLLLEKSAYPNWGNYAFLRPTLERVIQYTQGDQMRFSDAITRKYALNERFREAMQPGHLRMTREEMLKRTVDRCNQTTVGNIAFMAHYDPEGFFGDFYRSLIRKLKKKYGLD